MSDYPELRYWKVNDWEPPITRPRVLVKFTETAGNPYIASGVVPREVRDHIVAHAGELYRKHATCLEVQYEAEGRTSSLTTTTMDTGNIIDLEIAAPGDYIRMEGIEDGVLVLPIPSAA